MEPFRSIGAAQVVHSGTQGVSRHDLCSARSARKCYARRGFALMDGKAVLPELRPEAGAVADKAYFIRGLALVCDERKRELRRRVSLRCGAGDSAGKNGRNHEQPEGSIPVKKHIKFSLW